jgi:hypothetical protein
MRSGVDDLLYHHRIPADGYLLGTIYLGKLVQGRALGPLHSASLLAGFGEIPQSIGWTAMLCCDNKRALEVSSHPTCRIRLSEKCANIHRSLKAVTLLLNGTFHYVHIYGHMDCMLKWNQLTLTQQINCICNTLVKRSVTTAINHGYHDHPTQILPKEDVALVIWGNKITGDISPHLRFHANKEVAWKYLAS